MNKIIPIILTLLITCCASTAFADIASLFTPVTVRATGNYISSADYKDSDASSSVISGGIRLNAGGLSMSYEGKNYSWNKVNQLEFGNGQDNPWDALHRLTLGYALNGAINKSWFYGAGITGTSAFEEEMSDSFGGAVRGHIGYIFNENWSAIIGARVFINSIRASAMPFIGITYAGYDQDGAGFFLNLGAPSTEAGYAFSNYSKLRFHFSVDGKTYRLKDNSPVANAGYVELNSMVAGVYYDWKPFKGFSVSLGPEYYFSREMKTFDRHGDRFGGTIKQDAAFGGLLSLRYKF